MSNFDFFSFVFSFFFTRSWKMSFSFPSSLRGYYPDGIEGFRSPSYFLLFSLTPLFPKQRALPDLPLKVFSQSLGRFFSPVFFPVPVPFFLLADGASLLRDFFFFEPPAVVRRSEVARGRKYSSRLRSFSTLLTCRGLLPPPSIYIPSMPLFPVLIVSSLLFGFFTHERQGVN